MHIYTYIRTIYSPPAKALMSATILIKYWDILPSH